MAPWDGLGAALQDRFMADGWAPWLEVMLAAVAVYVIAIVLVRFGKKRFLGRNTVFDAILGFMLGSTLARAINGNATVGPTAVAAMTLVLLHWLFGIITYHDGRIGTLLKGRPDPLVKDGRLDEEAMREHHLSAGDLEEAVRKSGKDADLDLIKEARFERDGQISVVLEPQVLDVTVEEGVQRVRIVIG